MPDGYTAGGKTPHGLQFLGTAFSEPRLIGLAYSYEQASHARIPATVADPQITALTCGPPGTDLPEAPLTIGLPLAALVGGTLVLRRRHRAGRV